MAEIDNAALLAKFKITIGDLTPGTELDAYYSNFIRMAHAHLAANDISEEILAGELGEDTIVLYAQALMKGENVAEDKTLTLLRNTLSVQTKGNAYDNRG